MRGKAVSGLITVVNYNQSKEIGRFLAKLQIHQHNLDVLVVDDGSGDGSAEIAESQGFEVIRHPANRGVGASIRTGIRVATERGYSFVVIMAANGKMRPEDIAQVVAPITSGEADYVQGSRYLVPGSSISLTWFRRLMIPVFTAMTNIALGQKFTDVTCGFRAYRLDIFNRGSIKLDQEWLDRYELEFYIHYWVCKLGYRFKEVPVTMDYSHLEKGRKSKIVPLAGWWSMIRPFLFLATGLRK